MKKQKLTLFSALATVLDLAEETLARDREANDTAHTMGFTDQVNIKAEHEAIKRVSELYNLLRAETKHFKE